MKTLRKILASVFSAVIIAGSLIFPSAAEEAVLFDLSRERNMAITVMYDTEPPEVSFIAPDGTEYGDEAISDGDMAFSDSGNALYFRIPNAMAGEWTIVYDKGKNTELEVGYAPYAEGISIDSFTFTEGDADDELDTTFTVSYGEDEYFDYIISAVITENGRVAGERQLRTGRAEANEERKLTVDIGDLASHDSYELKLEVYMDIGGAEIFDTYIADGTFSYKNSSTPKPIEGFVTEVGVTENYIRLDWSETSVYCDGYIVAIFADDGAEPVYSAEFESNVTSTEVLVDTSVSELRAEIYYKNSRGMISEAAVKTIDMKMASALTLTCDEVTSASEARVDYDFSSFGEKIRTVIDVNGKIEEVLPEGAGSFSVNLDEGENDIAITWHVSEDLSFTAGAEVYSDRHAPVLLLYEATGDIKTDDGSFILTGSTEAGCTVTVNGETAEVDEDGLFSIELKLGDGENEFTVTATSPVGNSSKQVFTVEKMAPVMASGDVEGPLAIVVKFLPLIITFIFTVALVCHVFISTKVYRSRKEKAGRASAVFAVFRNTFIFIAVIALLCSAFFIVMTVKSGAVLDTVEFFRAASRSISEAYEMMEENDAWKLGMIISLISFGAAVILTVLTAILSAKLAKKPGAPGAPAGGQAPIVPPTAPAGGAQMPQQNVGDAQMYANPVPPVIEPEDRVEPMMQEIPAIEIPVAPSVETSIPEVPVIPEVEPVVEPAIEGPVAEPVIEEPIPEVPVIEEQIPEMPVVEEPSAEPLPQEEEKSASVEGSYCGKCGTFNAVGSIFCAGCGSKL